MITIRLCGGLGNQLFQLALGTEFEFRGRSVCYDVSSFESDRARRYMLGDLGFNLPTTIENAPVTFQEKSLAFDPAVLEIKKGVLNGYWQSEKYFADVDRYIRGQFTSRIHLSELTKAFALQIANLGSTSCFIHLRRSDNCDEFHKNGPYDGLTTLAAPYYQRAKLAVRDRVKKFFLFTDDREFAAHAYKGSDAFQLIGHNAPSFTEDSAHVLRKRPEGREVEDLYLMSLCHNAIIANSTFSWWGAYLYQNRVGQPRVVCAPDPWYALPTFGETEIIPETWTKISTKSASSDSEK